MPWNPSDLLVNGLSVASQQPQPTGYLNQPIRSLADLSGPGPAPQSVMDNPGASGGSILRYPNENIMYYAKIETYDYKRTGWNTVGGTSLDKTIVLPLPMQMIDNQNVKYSTEPLGVMGAIGMGAATSIGNFSDVINALKTQSTKDSIFKAIQGAGSLGLSAALDTLTGAGAKIADGVMATAGLAQNEFLTVMLEGPNYKERDFQWVLSPNSPGETESLRKIVQALNNAQAPTLSKLGYAFFQYPKIFKIEFMFNNDQSLGNILFRMRPMVLLNAQYNYTPHGVFAPFAKTNGPNAIELQLKFQEIELWVHNSENELAYNDTGLINSSVGDTAGAQAAIKDFLQGVGSNLGAAFNNLSNNGVTP